MTFPRFFFRRPLPCGAVACLLSQIWLGTAVVRAQSSTWTGAVDNAWGTPGNWSKTPAFDGTDQLLLNTLVQPSQNVGGTRNIHSLTLNQSGFTVAGGTLTLSNAGAGIASTGNNTIGSDITSLVPTTVQSNVGTLTLGGVISTTNGPNPSNPTLTGTGNFTVSGSVQGSGGLTMNGTGTLLLAGSNNFYTGPMTINAGTFKIAATALSTATGSLVLNAGGTFDLNGLNPSVSFLSGAGAVLLGGNTLTVTVGGDIVYPGNLSGPVSGSGGLVLKMAAGNAMILSGNNTYAGGTSVKGGFLLFNDDTNLGAAAGTLTLDGGGIKFAKNGTVTRPVVVGSGGATFTTEPGTTSALPSLISGSGPVRYGYNTSGEGTWVASGAYTYTGATTVGTGNLAVTDNAQLGAAGNTVTASGGTLLLRGGVTVPGRTLNLTGYGNSTNGSLGALVSDTGANAWSGPVVLGYVGSVGVASGSSLTLSGAITGSGGFTLNGVGDTLISGTVAMAITKNYGGTLTLSGGNSVYGLSLYGGTTVLAGANAVRSGRTVATPGAATLRLDSDQTLSVIDGYGTTGATLDLGSHDLTLDSSASFAGTVTGTGRLFMEGSGTLTLTGQNTFSGGLFIDNGTLVVGSDASFGAAGSPVVFRGGALGVYGANFPSTNRPLTFGTPNASFNIYSGTFTLAQALTNSGSLTKLGTGTLVLTGNNSYAGGTVLSGGTLSVASDAVLGAAGGGLTWQGGTLQVTGNTFHSTTRPITFGAAYYGGIDVADAANTFTLGAINGGAGITKLGAGTLVLTAPTSLVTVNANVGTLRLGTGSALAANSSLSVATGATLDLAGYDQSASFAGVSGTLMTGAGTLSVSGSISGYSPGGVIAGRLALTGSNVSLYSSNNSGTLPGGLTISAAVSGGGTLTMLGAGVVILTADNPFAGMVAVNAGTLSLPGSLLGLTSATVAQGATLDVAGGRLTTRGDVTNAGGLRLTDGAALSIGGNLVNNGFLRLVGSAAFAAGGTITNNGVLDLSAWNGTLPANFVNGKGGVVLDGTGLRITGFTRTNTTVQVTVNGQVGLGYQLQRATSLSPANWQGTGTTSTPQTVSVNGPLVLTDNYPPATGPGFYRVIVTQATSTTVK